MCDKVVCERCVKDCVCVCVTKLYVKDGVARADQRRPSAPPEPAQCQKRHACHANAASMSPSGATTTNGAQARRQTSVISATPATQMLRTYCQAPRLPRKVQVDVAKCHACLAKRKVDVSKRHACHANGTSMPPSAKIVCDKVGVKDCVAKLCVAKLCVKDV